jgi:acyl-CoA thioester hydrolase
VHEKRIEIRWRDLDAYNHVNNAVYLTYLEEARDEWLERSLGNEGSAWGYVLARVAIDFRRELTLEDDEVLATCALAGLGSSSVTTREELRTEDGELAAKAEAVLVAVEQASRTPRPLSESERAALEQG